MRYMWILKLIKREKSNTNLYYRWLIEVKIRDKPLKAYTEIM